MHTNLNIVSIIVCYNNKGAISLKRFVSFLWFEEEGCQYSHSISESFQLRVMRRRNPVVLSIGFIDKHKPLSLDINLILKHLTVSYLTQGEESSWPGLLERSS